MDYDVQEINAFDEFVGIENEWNTLLSNSHCNIPQLRHEWFRIWWSHFGQQNKMVVILIRANGRLVFAISLMEVRRSFFGLPFIVLESMTNYHSGRYSFLMENGEDKAQSVFFQYLHSRLDTWHMLQLQSVLDDINAHKSFINNARSKKLNVIMSGFSSSPYLPLDGDWDKYLKTLKRNFRSSMRNRTKRLKRLGVMDFEIASHFQDIEKVLDAGFEIEKKSWKGERGTAIACDSNLKSFYSEIAKVAMDNNWLRLSFLKVDGQRVAFDYCLAYEGKMYSLKIGYDPKFHKYSVGRLLTREMLKRCFEDNMNEFDFMGKSEKHKTDWTLISRKNSWIFICNKSIISRAYNLYRFKFRRKVKALLKK